MYLPCTILCLLIGISTFTYGIEFDYVGWLQLRLWQALNDEPMPNFVERGNITIRNVRSGTLVIEQSGLSRPQINQLKELAKTDGKYRLQVTARTSSGSEATFLTSIPACYLLGSDLRDTLTLWLDSAAEPMAVSLSAPGSCVMDNNFAKMWNTSVLVKYPDAGPAPDTATHIQKLEREREARERGETKDNRSFLAKYWMYIVAVVILFLLSSASNPEAVGGGTGNGQRQ